MLRTVFRNKVSKSLAEQSRWVKYVPGGNLNQVGVVDPEPHNLGHYYKYIYANNVDPELFGGLNKAYPNSYEAATMYEWDNWSFEYFGQWMDHGSPFWNWVVLLYPALIIIMMHLQQVSIFKSGGCFLLEGLETDFFRRRMDPEGLLTTTPL